MHCVFKQLQRDHNGMRFPEALKSFSTNKLATQIQWHRQVLKPAGPNDFWQGRKKVVLLVM